MTSDATGAVSPWMTRQQAADHAQTSVATIARAIRGGHLRAYRLRGGRSVRVHRDDVDKWLCAVEIVSLSDITTRPRVRS